MKLKNLMKNLSISHKLWAAFILLLATMFAIGSITLYQATLVQKRAEAELVATARLMVMSTRWMGMTETAVVRSMAAIISSDPVVEDLFKDHLANDSKDIGKLHAEVAQLATTPEDQAQLKQTQALGQAVLAAAKLAGERRAAGDYSGIASAVKNEYRAATQAYLGSIDQFAKLQLEKNRRAQADAAAAQSQTQLFAGIAGAVVLALGMGIAATLVRTIRAPLRQSVALAGAIASGDLTQRIHTDRHDEFGALIRSLGHMNESLAALVGQVRASTDSIGTASTQIAGGTQDLSSRTEHQASNLQQTASSMEELSATVKNSADSARQANQLASSAAAVAARGGEVVSQVVATMDDINASSKKIADIIGVIDGIAFQTNILALNAAVEAARAGEQGRGFAVVASEVRSLAQRSAQAAKEIKGLIGASVDKVEGGARLVADAGQTMTEIVSSVQRVTDIIGEITAASLEQSDGIGQVNTAVVQLDQMTQQNAALVEESAAAAESLKDQASRLAEVVGRFRVAA